jgi:hypothetical protein
MRVPTGRLITLLLSLALVASAAEAKTKLRVCRKACAPLVASVCPPKGKPLRKCRAPLIRDCRRQGVAVCAFGLPTSNPDTPPPGDGSVTTTTTTTSTTTTLPDPSVTTTTLPPDLAAVAGSWLFESHTIVGPACGFGEADDLIASTLAVRQDGAALSGTMEGTPASGVVTGDTWSFASQDDCRLVPATDEICCLTFRVDASGVTSPAGAQGTATATCSGGSTCAARWAGSVTRSE